MPDTPEAAVYIEVYDPSWPARFEAERALLEARIAPWLAGEIEHIGSTAVPSLQAKPVIDIMAPVHDLASSEPAIEALRALDYVHFPYRADVMHWFCKPSPSARTHHLHLVPLGSVLWRERIAFRDYLRAHAETRDAYGALKERLARAHRHDREAYTDAKWPFIERVLAEALAR